MGNKRNFFKHSLPNTFIGGVSATITSPAILATYLSAARGTSDLSVSNIESFEIIGSDIEFYVNINYYIQTFAFQGNTNVTYFKNTDDKLQEWADRCFQNATSFAEQQADYATLGLQGCFEGTALIIGDFPRVTNFQGGNSHLTNIPTLITLNTPVCIQYGNSHAIADCLINTDNIANIYTHPSMETINGGGVEADVQKVEDDGGIINYVT